MKELRDRYLAAQLRGDRAAALEVIDEAVANGTSMSSIYLDVIQAAQYEIGRLWEENAISIATEHQATAISQLALAKLYAKLPRDASNGKRVLIACVEGELHDMGTRLAADFLEMAGFDVRLLCANVPHTSLGDAVASYRPHVVALSATMTFHLPALERAIATIRSTAGVGVPIIVGGRAFAWNPAAAARLDAQGFGADASELVAHAKRLTARAA